MSTSPHEQASPMPDKNAIRELIATAQKHAFKGYIVTRDEIDQPATLATPEEVGSHTLSVTSYKIQGAGPWLLQQLLHAYREPMPSVAAAAKQFAVFAAGTFRSYYEGSPKSTLSAEAIEKSARAFAQGDAELYQELRQALNVEPKEYFNEFAKHYLVGYRPQYRNGKFEIGDDGGIYRRGTTPPLIIRSAPPAPSLPEETKPASTITQSDPPRHIDCDKDIPSKNQIRDARSAFRHEMGTMFERTGISEREISRQMRQRGFHNFTAEHVRQLSNTQNHTAVNGHYAGAVLTIVEAWGKMHPEKAYDVTSLRGKAQWACMDIEDGKGRGGRKPY